MSREVGRPMDGFGDEFFGSVMNAMESQMHEFDRLLPPIIPDPFRSFAQFRHASGIPGDGGNVLGLHRRNFGRSALAAGRSRRGGRGFFDLPSMPELGDVLDGGPTTSTVASESRAIVSMATGPDGHQEFYQASSSTKTGPDGLRETQNAVHDSKRGIKKTAIEHHLGGRAHIIEREQDMRSGQLEERQEFINMDESDVEDFDREFANKARFSTPRSRVRGKRSTAAMSLASPDDMDVKSPAKKREK